MKKKLLLIFLLFLSSSSIVCLANLNTSSIKFNNLAQDDIIRGLEFKGTTGGKGTIKRLPEQILVSGYIINNQLYLNFISPTPNAKITISNKLTNEVTYLGFCNTLSTVINLNILSSKGDGTYIIKVTTTDWERFGEFTY
jgi:hypothetical protein